MRVENNLGTDDIKKLVLRIAIPSMLAQFVSVLYSIVDRMYIGNIAVIGETALAGVGVCGPIVTLIAAFASWVGIGGSPLMSIRLGEKNEKAARDILANCFLMLFTVSVVITVLSLLLKDKLLMWFGASDNIFPYANQYITVYLLGTVFALLSVGMNQFIICQGFAKAAMLSVILGAVCNIILDPVFIFGMNMGVRGAAVATVISQMASCAYVLVFLFGKQAPIRITFGNYQKHIMKRVLILGFTPFVIIAFDNVLIIAMNTVLQKYGGPGQGDMLLTCATIVQSFMLIVTMPLGGITGGTQTILGFNYGARQTKRVLEAQKYIVLLSIFYTTVLFVIAQTIPQYFVGIFTQNPEYAKLTVWAIRVFTMGIIPLAVQYEIVDGYTGMGLAGFAITLSTIRKALYLTGVFLLPMAFGVTAAFYTEPISDILGTIVSITVYVKTIKKILRTRELENVV